MSEDIDRHVLRKYEIIQKIGKGVSLLHTRAAPPLFPLRGGAAPSAPLGCQGGARTAWQPGAQRSDLEDLLGNLAVLGDFD